MLVKGCLSSRWEYEIPTGESLLGSGNLFQGLWQGDWAECPLVDRCSCRSCWEIVGRRRVRLSASVGVFEIFRSKMVAVFFLIDRNQEQKAGPACILSSGSSWDRALDRAPKFHTLAVVWGGSRLWQRPCSASPALPASCGSALICPWV